ncbi:hypothetical protein KY284_008023 [Solanum tuberosum]|nr:hypothetical protein KY284_008023 [Solanum tuberosum]
MLGDDILKEKSHVVATQVKSEYPLLCHLTDSITNLCLYFSRTVAPRRKSAPPQPSPRHSPTYSENPAKSSASESKEGGSESDSGEESGSGFGGSMASNSGSSSGEGSGSDSDIRSGSGEEYASGSQEDVSAPPLTVRIEAKPRAQKEAGTEEEDDNVTSDDKIVQYVHLREFDPVVRQQLIDYFRSMWTVNRSEDFSKNGIMNKSGSFKDRPLMPEIRVVMADIQAFPDIYRLF